MRETVAYVDGHASPGLLRLQELEKTLLAALLEFCAGHGLQPFLVAGSALGAVRHGDIIPWDDDIDVGLMRDDFERLIGLLEATPIPGMFIQSHRTERNYPHAYAKLRLNNSAVHEQVFQGADIRDGVFIDIFPFDLLPESKLARRTQQWLLVLFSLVIMSFSHNAALASRNLVIRSLRTVAYWLRPLLPWRRLIRLRERVANPHPGRRSDEAVSFEMYGILHYRRTLIDVAILVPPSCLRFGNLTAPVPNDADRYLAALFGDYRQLPPLDRRKPLHVTEIDI